jgi:hypothetical protein
MPIIPQPHQPAVTDPTTDPTTELAALVTPPAACPGCLAAASQPFPARTTSRYCPSCLAHLRGTADGGKGPPK